MSAAIPPESHHNTTPTSQSVAVEPINVQSANSAKKQNTGKVTC